MTASSIDHDPDGLSSTPALPMPQVLCQAVAVVAIYLVIVGIMKHAILRRLYA